MMAVRTLLATTLLLASVVAMPVATRAAAQTPPPPTPAPTEPGAAGSATETASESSSSTAQQPANTSGPVESLAGSVASGLADRALDSLFESIGESAIWAFGKVLSWIDETSSPDVTQRWFGQTYARTYWLATTIALVALVWAITTAALRNGVTGVVGVLPRVLYVAVGLAVAIPLVQTLLQFTDWLSAQVAGQTSQNLSDMAGALGKVLVGSVGVAGIAARSGGIPAMVVGFLALVILVGALVVWLELIFRSAAIYLLLAAAAFPAALSINKSSAKPIRKVAAWIIALAFAKPVIVLAFWVGSAPFASGGQADVTAVLTGAGTMMTAVFAPWALFRLFDFAGEQMTAAFASSASPQQLRTHVEQPVSTYRRTATAVRERAAVLRDQGVAGFSPHRTRAASAATSGGAAATGGALVLAGTAAATAGTAASKRAVRGLAATEPGGGAGPGVGPMPAGGPPGGGGGDGVPGSPGPIPARPSRAAGAPVGPDPHPARRAETLGPPGRPGTTMDADGRDLPAPASPVRPVPAPRPRTGTDGQPSHATPAGPVPPPQPLPPADATPRRLPQGAPQAGTAPRRLPQRPPQPDNAPRRRPPRPPVDPRGDAR